MTQTQPDNYQQLFQYSKILSTIIQLDQQNRSSISPNQKQSTINDIFSIIQKAYWFLYLQQNKQTLTQQQRKQIGKSLDSELITAKNQSTGSFPKWFMYKNNMKRENNNDDNNWNDEEMGYQQGKNNSKMEYISPATKLKHQNSLSLSVKNEQRQSIDPYHSNIKIQAANGGLSQLQVIYKFFNIHAMLQNSGDMMDIQKITILHRKGNTFDKRSKQQVLDQKQKFRKKFKLYTQLIFSFKNYGYGSRIAKRYCKQKVTGTLYQYAVVHISKIMFKLLQRYVMSFINNKAMYTSRSKFQKVAYNMFNLPDFFTPQLHDLFTRILYIVFQVENPLPIVTKKELGEIYKHIIGKIDEKQKNPEKFKNEYMLKLQNPTFYNVPRNIRDKVKQESDERKRLGIHNKGRKSKVAKQLNQLKQSIAQEQQFLRRSGLLIKQSSVSRSSIKFEEKMKQQYKRSKRQVEHESQQEFQGQDSEGDYSDDAQYQQRNENNKIQDMYFESDEESQDIRDYFHGSHASGKKEHHKKKSREHKSKKKSKTHKKHKNKSESDESQSD